MFCLRRVPSSCFLQLLITAARLLSLYESGVRRLTTVCHYHRRTRHSFVPFSDNRCQVSPIFAQEEWVLRQSCQGFLCPAGDIRTLTPPPLALSHRLATPSLVRFAFPAPTLYMHATEGHSGSCRGSIPNPARV